MLHHRALIQRLRETRKLRRSTPAARRMPNIIANKANRESTPPRLPAHAT